MHKKRGVCGKELKDGAREKEEGGRERNARKGIEGHVFGQQMDYPSSSLGKLGLKRSV